MSSSAEYTGLTIALKPNSAPLGTSLAGDVGFHLPAIALSLTHMQDHKDNKPKHGSEAYEN